MVKKLKYGVQVLEFLFTVLWKSWRWGNSFKNSWNQKLNVERFNYKK